MASLPAIQASGALRSQPGRSATFLQASCSHRVTPFTSKTRKLTKRAQIKHSVPWSSSCGARRTSSRVYAASVEESQPEEVAAEEAEVIVDDDDEVDALLDDEEFKPHAVFELTDEQFKDRSALRSTLAKSIGTNAKPLTAEQEEEEQGSQDLAASVVEAALDIERKFGNLRGVSGGSKESPLPFSDDKFWQDVEDDVETLEVVENFDNVKVAQSDPFLQYLINNMAPKSLDDDEAFHADPDIAALRDAVVDEDNVEYTDEEKEVLAMLEGDEVEDEEDMASPVLDALAGLLKEPQTLTEEEQQAAQEAASEPVADANELLSDKDFASVVDMAALAAGFVEHPDEQTENIKWLANRFSKTAAETTYSEVVATALEAAQSAADAGDLQAADAQAFKGLMDELAAATAESSASSVDLGESFTTAYNDALASISKHGFVEPVAINDTSSVDNFLGQYKDQLTEFEALEAAFNELSLPSEKSAREQSQELLFNLITEVDDPELNAAAMVTDVSLADAASAKDFFLQEAKEILSEQDYQKVQSYVQGAFIAKVRNTGNASEEEPEVPQLQFPEVEGLDHDDEAVDNVLPDFSKIVAEVDDADDYELDDFDEDVVKFRHVKAELFRTMTQDEDEDVDISGSGSGSGFVEDASASSLKMLMQLVEDAGEGRPLLKDFKLEDEEVAGETEFPSVEAVLAKIREGGSEVESAVNPEMEPVLQRLLPHLMEATQEVSLETPTFESPLPEDADDDEGFELQDLYDPIGDFTTPVINEAVAAADIDEYKRVREELDQEMYGDGDADLSDDEFEADEKEKALLAETPDVPTEQLLQQWAENDGYLDYGAPETDLSEALAKADAAAKAFDKSTSGLDDPSGLSDEDCVNLKIAFDNLYLIKAATSPEAMQLKQAAEQIRVQLLAHRFSDAVKEYVESTVTRGHLDDLNLLQFDQEALNAMEDEQADQAIGDLVDKLTDVAEGKLVAAAEEAVKDFDDLDLPEVEGTIPEDIGEQFEAAMVERYGAQRLGEMQAEAEIQSFIDNPRLLGLDLDPAELMKGEEFDPEDPLTDLKLLEESGVVPPVEEDEAEETVAEADAEAEAETKAVADEEEEDVPEGEDSMEPPTVEGAIFADLIDQVMDSLQKVDNDELYVDDDVYDAEADTEASAAAEDEAAVDEEEFDEEDAFDADAIDDVARAMDETETAEAEDDDDDEDEELSGLVFTDSAARSGAVEEEDDDDLDEFGEEEGEGDVAPEDMRNEYNSFMSEELFGNPTFADIWEEMGIPEMRPKEPVRMDQEDYDANAANALEEQEDEDTRAVKAKWDREEGEDDQKDVPIGNWFGDDDDEELAEVAEDAVDEDTSLTKLSKYYGANQNIEGLENSDSPMADLDVFSGSRYLDGGDDDDRAADDVTGLMERVTMTKEGVVFIERVIQVQRVVKVVKGGNIMSFRCTAVVGNRAGIVGVGVGSAREVAKAVQKAVSAAKKEVIMVPLTKYASIPHRIEKKFKASQCVINPAADGTGCIAGGAIRSVLELAGVKNCLAKQLGSRNPMNNAKLCVEALKDLQTWGEVAAKRSVPIEYLFAQNQDEADRALAEYRNVSEDIY